MRTILKLSIVMFTVFFLVSCGDAPTSTYTITFETQGGTPIENLLIVDKSDIELITPTRIGYTFEGWHTNSALTDLFDVDLYVLSDITLYAKWSLNAATSHPLLDLFEAVKSYPFAKYRLTSDTGDKVYYEKGLTYAYIDLEEYDEEGYLYKMHSFIKEENQVYTLFLPSDVHISKFYQHESTFLSFNHYTLLYNQLIETVIFEDIDMDWFDEIEQEYILKESYFETFGARYLELEADEVLEGVIYKISDTGLMSIIKMDGHTYTITIDATSGPAINLNVETVEKVSVQGVTDTSIKIGHLLPTSGPMGTIGYAYQMGIKAYIDYINQQGGIHGRTIDLVSYTQDYDYETSISNLRKLLIEDQVFALVGHQDASSGELERKMISEIYLPLVAPTRFMQEVNPMLMDFNVYPVDPTFITESAMLSQMVISQTLNDALGDSKVGVIYTMTPYHLAILDGLNMHLGDHLVYYGLSVGDHDDIVSAINTLKQNDVEAVIILTSPQVFQSSLSFMTSLDLHVDCYTTTRNNLAFSETFYIPFKVYANGWFNLYEDREQNTLSNDFILFNQVMSQSAYQDYQTNPFTIQGYQAAYVFVEGLKRHTTSELTFLTYSQAMNASLVDIPFAGSYSYQFKHHTLQLFEYDRITNTFYQITDDIMPLS